jgi:hypothetical protein
MTNSKDNLLLQAKKHLDPYDLKIISRENIDTQRWDTCVASSVNESPLAYCWVSDILCPGWKGLVINDYKGVMPLTITKKMGLLALQIPQEVISLGIFSENPEIVQTFPYVFFHPLFRKFKFISYNGSPSKELLPELPYVQIKQTFELDLNQEYEKLYRSYSRTHRRSIRDFYKTGLTILTDPYPDVFTSLLAEIGRKRPELFMPTGYRKKFRTMTKAALDKYRGVTYSVWHNDHLIGGTFFLIGNKRIIPYHAANEEGRSFKTSFALIDRFIKDNAGQKLILDFAGSVLPNIATFNRRFGANPVPYCSAYINRLPLPLRMAKEKHLLFQLKRLFSG